MTAVSEVTPRVTSGPQWARRYPPLFAVSVAMVIALAVLPSSLNIPQANPAQTLEYAPVPPDDEAPPPNQSGNLSSLGLAGSSSLEAGASTTVPEELDELLNPDDDGPGGKGDPTSARCVDGKQTEDPLSPPCVANFEGDNFGETYQGVDEQEIRVLFYLEGFIRYTACSGGNEETPDGTYFDLSKPEDPANPDHCIVRMLRGWQKFFNSRYQTYGRQVNFWAYYATGGLHPSGASRKADAADNYKTVDPFAVMSYARENSDAYLESMANRGVLNFGAFVGREEAFFRRYAKLIWGFYPSLEQQAAIFNSFVCSKVVKQPVSFSGSPAQNGQKRVLGLWRTDDKDRPELLKFRDLVRQGIENCGGVFAAEQTFPSSQYVQDNSTTPEYAAIAAAEFQDKGVTTIIWPGGLETNLSKQSGAWRPEIVAAGDLFLDGNSEGQYQESSFWQNAWILTNVVYHPNFEDSYCYLAYTSVDPSVPRSDLEAVGCELYSDIRQLFTGIQLAGPRLGPTSIDKGFRAIKPYTSENAKEPSCFYSPGDYTCTKDATLEYWDPAGDSPNNDRAGCWRMHQEGKRFLANTFPESNVNVPAKDPAKEFCNGFNGGGLINPNPPSAT